MAHILSFPIDIKSLYWNIFNDNEKGHTCTVATPIKQGKTGGGPLEKIYLVPKQIDFQKHEGLIRELIKNSKSTVKVNNVFVFDKLSVNGVPFECGKSFCFFVKEEIDSTKAQFGRTKLHYPITLKYDDLDIDNRRVINAISDALHGYGFVIEEFRYDFDNDVLDFRALIVGYPNIPYSKVFINKKGVGFKFNTIFGYQFGDTYDSEIIAIRKKHGEGIGPNNFGDVLNAAREKAHSIAISFLEKSGAKEIRRISSEYPYSVYDYQYSLNGTLHHSILKFSFSQMVYVDLSSFQVRMLNEFDNTSILFIRDLDGQNDVVELDKTRIASMGVMLNEFRYYE